MTFLDKCVGGFIRDGVFKNAAIRVGVSDRILIDGYYSEGENPPCDRTLFDMASATKIIATTSLTLIAVDKGLLSISDKVSRFFEVSDDKSELTVENLLCHSMGIGHKSLSEAGIDYDNVAKYILSIPSDVRIGVDYIYSCPAFILLGKILERLFGKRLDELLFEYVTSPLGMRDTGYLPSREGHSFAPCNFRGEAYRVNDYNCDYLGGVSGNAGVFSNISDMTVFAKMLLSEGSPVIERDTFRMAARKHGNEGFSESRGLGFLFVDEKYDQTGELFPKGSIGHCGHTGQSIFVHVESGLYAIILTDATATLSRKSADGSYDYGNVCEMRRDLHNAIARDIKNI